MRTYVASEELVLSEEAEERRLLGVVPDNFQAGQSARTARLEGRVVATERSLHVVTNQRCARVIFINHIQFAANRGCETGTATQSAVLQGRGPIRASKHGRSPKIPPVRLLMTTVQCAFQAASELMFQCDEIH
jgi:hypothetical protein